MLAEFYEILFDPGQHTCFGETHKSTAVSPARAQTRKPFVTLNALHARRDLHPTEIYHAASKPRRADHNVVCLRNILIEMDHGSAAEQVADIRRAGVPWSTCVSSGGKSLHFVVSLEEPLADRVSYARLVRRIYEALKTARVKIDEANKNPSRFTRAPGVIRPETGVMQELVQTRARVKNQALENWCAQMLPHEPAPARTASLLSFPRPTKVFASTQDFLERGAPAGEWNTRLFRAACNLFSLGESSIVVIERFRRITGTLDTSDLATIRSAERRIQSGA